jgi:hypothetical protein
LGFTQDRRKWWIGWCGAAVAMQSTGMCWIALYDILSEVGSDMSRFATEAHFVSYQNPSPNNKISEAR